VELFVRAAGLLATLTACWTGSPKLVAEPVPVIDDPPACREVPMNEPAAAPTPVIEPPPNLRPRLKPNTYVRRRLRALWFIALAGCSSPAQAQPASPPAKNYVLPQEVSDALANEKLAGNVLVRGDAKLYPTAAAARGDTAASKKPSVAMRVIADHGDVVELSTAPTKDCIASWDEPYQLRVFVKREELVPRLKTAIDKRFSDGTAVVIDRGAPVTVAADGLRWEMSDIAAALAPSEDQLALSVPAMTKPVALPPFAKGERLVCNGSPTPQAEWLKKPKKDRGSRERWCGIESSSLSTGKSAVPPPTVDGKPVAWPWTSPPGTNEHVVRSSTGYIGDVQYPCGRVRMAVTGEGVHASSVAITGFGVGPRLKAWAPTAGPVTWLDGTPAGKYDGGKKYTNVIEEPKRICVRLRNVAEPVCHAKARVKTMMVTGWEVD
jgi:hypothetical protein